MSKVYFDFNLKTSFSRSGGSPFSPFWKLQSLKSLYFFEK